MSFVLYKVFSMRTKYVHRLILFTTINETNNQVCTHMCTCNPKCNKLTYVSLPNLVILFVETTRCNGASTASKFAYYSFIGQSHYIALLINALL